jgi:hypothetical protein
VKGIVWIERGIPRHLAGMINLNMLVNMVLNQVLLVDVLNLSKLLGCEGQKNNHESHCLNKHLVSVMNFQEIHHSLMVVLPDIKTQDILQETTEMRNLKLSN